MTCTAPAGAAGVSRLDLRWEKVSGATSYEVLQLRNGKWWFNEDDPNRTPLTTSTSIGGLDAETNYEFTVRAVNDQGLKSPLSSTVFARTLSREINLSSNPTPQRAPTPAQVQVTSPKDKTPAPEPPSGLFAMFPDQEKAKISWRPVPGAVRYSVEEEKEGKWSPCQDVVGEPAATTVFILNHPTPGPYKFRIRSVGANGKLSEPSWVVNLERN